MIEAQQSLISSIVLDQDALVEVIDNLNVNDFTTDRHRRIISAAFDLTNENKEIDVVSLGERSDSLDYLIECTTESHRMSLPVAIGMVKNESVRRLSLSNLDFAIQKVLKCKTPDEQVLALEAVTNGIDVGRDDFRVLQEVMRDATKRISDKLDGKFVEGFKTGFNTIDERLGGFVEGNMVVVGARPSMGKTTYALNVCENVAKAGGNTIFFSLEMSADELADKMISSSSGLSTDVIRKPRFGPGSLDEDGQSKLMAGMSMINGFANNFTVIDKAALHINHLRNIARKFDRVRHLDLIVIDYLQLLRADSQNRFDEISEISRSIKALAKELNTTVLVLSQLSREVDKRNDSRPINSDLRESGQIEQDADIIQFLYRDEIYNKKDSNPNKGLTEVITTKFRNGVVGTDYLESQLQFSRFINTNRFHVQDEEQGYVPSYARK